VYQQQINATEFLNVVRAPLAQGDAAQLAHAVRIRWRPSELAPLLRDPSVDVRRVAAVTLGLIGKEKSTPYLIRALRDEDLQVNQMAEHGLWSIWFRSGDPKAAKPFREGVALLSDESYDFAISKFQESIRLDPQFPEAHNQCAVAHYFVAQWEEAIGECRKTIELIPSHFGAISGIGHCYTQMDNLPQALRCYRWALRINPRMQAISRAAQRIEGNSCDLDSSGEFLLDQIMQ